MRHPYVELHAHSAFSFLDGASLPHELVAAASAHGHEALALTDHDGVWGSMEHAQACREAGVRPISGTELTVAEGEARFHLTLLVESPAGWRNLCRLLSEAHSHTRKSRAREQGEPSVTLEQVERHADGLVCLSGCARQGVLAGGLGPGAQRASPEAVRMALGRARRLRDAFGPERFRVELQRPLWRHDRARNRALSESAERLGVACVATGNVHMHARSRRFLQDALVAVRLGGTLEETEPRRRGNGSAFLDSPERMAQRFADHPDAVAETVRLAERLSFDLTREIGYRYPGAEDETADRTLAEVCRSRFEHRYAGMPERAEAERRLEEELRVIRKLGLSGFFLLHHDLLELAREVALEVRGPDSARNLLPPGRGRGSSVSSVVCYLTGLSHVDPVKAGLFLGRFLNDEITAVPDIDLDFPRDVREQLIPRIHERYGHERSALVAAFPTYRSRGAVRDLGKALGLPGGEIERVAKLVDVYGKPDEVERDIALAIGSNRASAERWRWLAHLSRDAFGLPRHASQHSGGMVLSTRPLIDLCPVVPAAMEGRQIVMWDKDSCADAGFLKIDLLGLGMLSAVERCVEEIDRVRGERIDLSRIPLDDEETYRMIREADTTGVFQIESRAQMQMLPRSQPESIEDLAVQVAIVRPGPIQGGAVHPYLDRRKRLRVDPSYEVPYEDPSLEPILSDTLGAIVFQDQVIQVAMALAGFTAGEAEALRRAMSRKRSEAALLAQHERFVDGAVARGVAAEVAERVFDQIKGFSGFGFPKSHAVAFALLAYQSTWLRLHYGPEFLCSLLNEQPMGFYPPDSLVNEGKRKGIDVRGVDVNRSGVDCMVEPGEADLPAVRVGLGYVSGLKKDAAEAVVCERERSGPYASLTELASRTGIGREATQLLAWAGACESLARSDGVARRDALWQAGAIPHGSTPASGDRTQLALPLGGGASPPLRALDRWEEVLAGYESLGLALGEHPMALIRPELIGEGADDDGVAGIATTRELEAVADGTRLTIAGMTTARQRPATANGIVFMLIEDEWGPANIVVFPQIYERDRLAVRGARFVLIAGRLERREDVVNIIAERVTSLSAPGAGRASVKAIEPGLGAAVHREPGRAAELASSLPAEHSFGRRAG